MAGAQRPARTTGPRARPPPPRGVARAFEPIDGETRFVRAGGSQTEIRTVQGPILPDHARLDIISGLGPVGRSSRFMRKATNSVQRQQSAVPVLPQTLRLRPRPYEDSRFNNMAKPAFQHTISPPVSASGLVRTAPASEGLATMIADPGGRTEAGPAAADGLRETWRPERLGISCATARHAAREGCGTPPAGACPRSAGCGSGDDGPASRGPARRPAG